MIEDFLCSKIGKFIPPANCQSHLFTISQTRFIQFLPKGDKASVYQISSFSFTDGVRGLYRGFVVSCICIFIYRGLYFGLYDSLKPILLGDNAAWVHTFLLGWGVTITSGLVIFYANVTWENGRDDSLKPLLNSHEPL